MHINAGRQAGSSRSQSSSASSKYSRCSVSSASHYSSRSTSGENHHLTNQRCSSSLLPHKRAHSYSEELEHRPTKDSSVFAMFMDSLASKGTQKKGVPPSAKHQAWMAASVEDTFPPCDCPDWELFADLNEIQADDNGVENKLFQIEPCYYCIHNKMPCYDVYSTCTLATSLVEFIDDDSSVDSFFIYWERCLPFNN